MPFFITSIISNCTVLSVPVIVKLKKYYTRVSIKLLFRVKLAFVCTSRFIVIFYFMLLFTIKNLRTHLNNSMARCSLSLICLTLSTDEGNQALQEFLAARNPKQQHSSTLESYLIKPIQRILKYPLLLQQLRNLTDVNSEEHLHLVGKSFELDINSLPSHCHCIKFKHSHNPTLKT